MSKINLILLIAVFAFCSALPRPSDEVVEAVVPVEAADPVEAEGVKDETILDDSARIHKRPHNPLLNPYLHSNLGVTNNLNNGLFSPVIVTQSPLSFPANIVLQPAVPGLIGK